MTDMNFRYAGIIKDDVVNGKGFRYTLFFQGCKVGCPGCQNPGTWDFSGGKPFTAKDYKDMMEYLAQDYVSGLSLTGGNPLDSPEATLFLVRNVKQEFPEKNIWLWTGYTWENLIERDDEIVNSILHYIDVLIDGPYVEKLRDTSLAFRGSSNQRIIDVQHTTDPAKPAILNL